jgi:hypothetical protein
VRRKPIHYRDRPAIERSPLTADGADHRLLWRIGVAGNLPAIVVLAVAFLALFVIRAACGPGTVECMDFSFLAAISFALLVLLVVAVLAFAAGIAWVPLAILDWVYGIAVLLAWVFTIPGQASAEGSRLDVLDVIRFAAIAGLGVSLCVAGSAALGDRRLPR